MRIYSLLVFTILLICSVSCNKDDDEITAENYIAANFSDDNGSIDYFGNDENGFVRVSNRTIGDRTEVNISSRDAATDVTVRILIKDFQGAGVYDFSRSSDNGFLVLFTEREIPYIALDGVLTFEITSTSNDRFVGKFSGEIVHASNSNLKRIIQNGIFSLPKSNF